MLAVISLISVVLGEHDRNKQIIAKNTCLKIISLSQTASFEPLCIESDSQNWAAHVMKILGLYKNNHSCELYGS